MIKVYVDSMPTEQTECPFFGNSNKKCRITDNKCCLDKNPSCEHLITLFFDLGGEEDGLGDSQG